MTFEPTTAAASSLDLSSDKTRLVAHNVGRTNHPLKHFVDTRSVVLPPVLLCHSRMKLDWKAHKEVWLVIDSCHNDALSDTHFLVLPMDRQVRELHRCLGQDPKVIKVQEGGDQTFL